MNDSFWSQMDAVVAETLNDHKFMDKIEPPRTVKKIMNVVKRTYVRFTTKISKSKQRLLFSYQIPHDEKDLNEPPGTVKNVMNVVKRHVPDDHDEKDLNEPPGTVKNVMN
eukprot:g1235.t1